MLSPCPATTSRRPLLRSLLIFILLIRIEHVYCQSTNAAQFTSAADLLISEYIPSSVFAVLAASIGPAASAASVAGNPTSLIYDALLAISEPAWFSSAIPTRYSSAIAALESNINELRATEPTGVSSSSSLSLNVTSGPTSTGSQTGTDLVISTSSSSTFTSPSSSGTVSPGGSSSKLNPKSTNTLAIGLGVGLGLLTLFCLTCGGILFFRMRKRLQLLENGRNAHPIIPDELGEGNGEVRAEVQGMEVGKPPHELEGERAVEIG